MIMILCSIVKKNQINMTMYFDPIGILYFSNRLGMSLTDIMRVIFQRYVLLCFSKSELSP